MREYYEYGNGTYGRVSYVFTGGSLAGFWNKTGFNRTLMVIRTAALVCQSLSVLCLAFMKEAGAEEAVLPFFLNAWGPYLAGVLPGAALSGAFQTGLWDRCRRRSLFLVSGLLLGLRHNLLFLCGTILCCGLFGLGYYVWSRMKGNYGAGKIELPLLPFAVFPGIWTAALYVTQIRTVGI